LRVLKGLALDLCKDIQINFVTCLFLRGCGRDEQQSREERSTLPEAVQIHRDSRFSKKRWDG